MNVESLTLANQSKITSSSLGTVANAGDAGNITIQSGSTVLLNDSSITTEASASQRRPDHDQCSGDDPADQQRSQHIRQGSFGGQ